MEATINIKGCIGMDFIDVMKPLKEGYVTYADVVGQIDEAKKQGATSYNVLIDSVGGSVNEAFRIANLIEGLQEPTTAIGKQVYSAANIIYFACQYRAESPDTVFMLHKSWLNEVTGNADDFVEIASALATQDARMFGYVAEKAGIPLDKVADLVNGDTFIKANTAKLLGFFGERADVEKQILALYNNMDILAKIKKLLASANGSKAMLFTLKDGKEIFVESEDSEIVGKPTDAPDGVHEAEDGAMITVKDGIVTDYKAAGAGMTTTTANTGGDIEKELQDLRAQNAELQAKNIEMQGQLNAAAKAMEEATALFEKRTKALEKATATNASPAKRDATQVANASHNAAQSFEGFTQNYMAQIRERTSPFNKKK